MFVDLRNIVWRLFSFWTNLSYIWYILFSVFIVLLFQVPVVIVLDYLEVSDIEKGGPNIKDYSIKMAIITTIVIAPIFETWVGQMIPIKVIQKFINWNTNIFAVMSSTILFGLLHLSYSFWYFLITLPVGFVLAVTYFIFQKRNQSPFWTTALIHAIRNAIAVFVTFYEN